MPRGKSTFKTMDNIDTDSNMRVSPITNANNLDVPQMREMNPAGSITPPLNDLEDTVLVKELSDDISVNEYMEDIENKFMSSSSDIHGGLFVPEEKGIKDIPGKLVAGAKYVGSKLVETPGLKKNPTSVISPYKTPSRIQQIKQADANNPKKRAYRGLKYGIFGQGKEYNGDLILKEISDDVEVKSILKPIGRRVSAWGERVGNKIIDSQVKNIRKAGAEQAKRGDHIGKQQFDNIADDVSKEGRKFTSKHGGKIAAGVIGGGTLAAGGAGAVGYKLYNDRSKGFEEIEVKELSDDIEIKSWASDLWGKVKAGKKIYNTAREAGKTPKEAIKEVVDIAETVSPQSKKRYANFSGRTLTGIGIAGGVGTGYGLGKSKKEYSSDLKLKELSDDIEIKGIFNKVGNKIADIPGHFAKKHRAVVQRYKDEMRDITGLGGGAGKGERLKELRGKQKASSNVARDWEEIEGGMRQHAGKIGAGAVGAGTLAGGGMAYGATRKRKGFDDIEVKELSDDIEIKGTKNRVVRLVTEGGRKVLKEVPKERAGFREAMQGSGPGRSYPGRAMGADEWEDYLTSRAMGRNRKGFDDIEIKAMGKPRNMNFNTTMKARNMMRPPGNAKMGKPMQPVRPFTAQRSQGNPMSARTMTPPQKPTNAPVAKNLFDGNDVVGKGARSTALKYLRPLGNEAKIADKNISRHKYYKKLMANPDTTGNLGYANRNEALLGNLPGFKLRGYTDEIHSKAMAVNIAKNVVLPAGIGLGASILGGDIANRFQDRRNRKTPRRNGLGRKNRR